VVAAAGSHPSPAAFTDGFRLVWVTAALSLAGAIA
jgi:hypothetical protein